MTEKDKQRAGAVSQTDLAADRMGRNSLQGRDQSQNHNQRRAVAEVSEETEGVVESFERMDEDERARKELNKGARSGRSDRD